MAKITIKKHFPVEAVVNAIYDDPNIDYDDVNTFYGYETVSSPQGNQKPDVPAEPRVTAKQKQAQPRSAKSPKPSFHKIIG